MRNSLLILNLTKAQYHRLMILMKQDEETHASIPNTTISSALMAGIYCLLSNHYIGWIIDSGASYHICHDLHLFDSYEPLYGDTH